MSRFYGEGDFEIKNENYNGVNFIDIGRKSTLSGGNRKWEGFEVEVCLVCLTNRKRGSNVEGK